jgi:hypothetical protein
VSHHRQSRKKATKFGGLVVAEKKLPKDTRKKYTLGRVIEDGLKVAVGQSRGTRQIK